MRRRALPSGLTSSEHQPTTRSRAASPVGPVLERALDRRVERVEPIQRDRLGAGEPVPGRRIGAVMGQHTVGEREVDRKSTRLNSSHPSISYAVFCLKKKKKKIIRETWHNVLRT